MLTYVLIKSVCQSLKIFLRTEFPPSEEKVFLFYSSFTVINSLAVALFPARHADISGEYVYSDTTRHRVVFDMEARIPDNTEVTMAELKLYQRSSHHKRFALEKRSHRPVNNARVSVYWVEVMVDGSNRTSLVDSR